MLRTDPAVAARRMGMTSPEDFGRGADRTTGYLSAVRVVHSVPSHIHSMALTDDARLFTWGCGSNGRCGLDAIVQIQGRKKRTMKCYVHCPSEIESLEGKRIVSAAVGKWWTWAIVDE
jgi:alpha-tubulin suppressor-like RCC1 family protein